MKRAVVVTVAAGVAIALPAVGLAAAYAYQGDVPRGTTVRGVDIGAQGRQQAVDTLTAGLEEQAGELAAPVTVRVGDGDDASTVEVVPADVDLAVDVPATVDQAASGGNPFRGLLGAWLPPREVEPVVTVDADLLAAELADAAGEVSEPMTMPEIRFEGTEPVPVYPEPGIGLDPERAAEVLTAAWPPVQPTGVWRAPEVVAVPLGEVTPVTTADDVDRLLDELARPAVAAPVSVTLPDEEGADSLELSPETIAGSLRLTADDRGEITPRVDPEALREGLAGQLDEVETAPVDARFTTDGGEPEIVAGSEGERVDLDTLAQEVLPVLAQPGPRTVQATMTTASPDTEEADLAELGVDQEVASFTTEFSGGLSSPRSQNIVLISEMVDGTLVMPDEVFSLNGHTGPRDYDDGFQDAPVIIDGVLRPAVGGGLSQFTTTLFNAAFYAGLEIVDHQPHSYHYSRYPAVLESTIFYDSIDFKFRNDSGNGVVIDTSYTEDSITVTMWGTPVWDDVEAEWSDRRDPTQPQRRYIEPGPDCIATSGIPGFTQDAWRVFYRDGEEVDREQFTWRYDAQPEVICGEEPDDG